MYVSLSLTVDDMYFCQQEREIKGILSVSHTLIMFDPVLLGCGKN